MLDTLQFYGDSLVTHGTLPRMGSVAPFMPTGDRWIGTAIIFCIIVLLPALAGEFAGLKNRLMGLTSPAGSRAAQELAMAQVAAGERWRAVIFVAIESVMLAALHITWMAVKHPWISGVFLQRWEAVAVPIMLLVVEAMACFVVFWMRRLLYQWIHATFFERDARFRWRHALRISMGAEAVFLTIAVCAAGSYELSVSASLQIAILSVFLPRIGLLWCAWQVFFVKSRTILHFFAYLCSAELIPLACLWLLLGKLFHMLTV